MTQAVSAGRVSWRRRIWVVYWLLLFTATHLPPSQAKGLTFNIPDWALHGVTYGALALLTTWNMAERQASQRAGGGSVGFVLLGWYGVLLLYGAIDELTQALPFIHRHCELRDWISDAVGSGLGFVVGYLVHVARK